LTGVPVAAAHRPLILEIECGKQALWQSEGIVGQKGHWTFKYLSRT